MNKIKNVFIKIAIGTIVLILIVLGCFTASNIIAKIIDCAAAMFNGQIASIVELLPTILPIIFYVLTAVTIAFCIYVLYRIGDDIMKELHR